MYPRHPPFDLDQFAPCYRVYTQALLNIQHHQDSLGKPSPSDSTRLIVALRIIEASANGVRELPDLERLAIGDLTAGTVDAIMATGSQDLTRVRREH